MMRNPSGSKCNHIVGALRRPGFDEVLAADVGALFGLELDLGDHEADELALQGALF